MAAWFYAQLNYVIAPHVYAWLHGNLPHEEHATVTQEASNELVCVLQARCIWSQVCGCRDAKVYFADRCTNQLAFRIDIKCKNIQYKVHRPFVEISTFTNSVC